MCLLKLILIFFKLHQDEVLTFLIIKYTVRNFETLITSMKRKINQSVYFSVLSVALMPRKDLYREIFF